MTALIETSARPAPFRRLAWLLILILNAHPARADDQAALQKAQRDAAMFGHAAAAARVRVRDDTARAALLAEQQVAAALQLRRLEDQTGRAAQALARLQAQSAFAETQLRANEAALAKLLPIMQRLSAQPAATMLATPESPVDSVRGILVLQSVAVTIEQQARAVRDLSRSVIDLVSMITAQQQVLLAAVGTQQAAEDSLTAQIAAARAAETADINIAAAAVTAQAAANATAHDLRAVIVNLEGLPGPAPQPAGALPPGGGMAPVAGNIVENFGDPTVAGPAQGVTYLAAPGARVAAPCAGGVKFADRFQSYGLLVILDCGADHYFVLSGMSRLDVASGQTVARGQPVGEMLRFDAKNPTRQPALYIELRQNGQAVDPAAWLTNGGSG